jgi:RND family efflux transporter MFP subunit
MLCGCTQQPAASSDKATAPETAEVKTVSPEKKDVRRLIERPGYNIDAYERTALYARISGYVRKWNADIGDRVRKDDVLAELYVPEMEVELKQKDAGIRQASAEIAQAKAAVLRSQAELERAQSQYERLARVGRSGVIDKEQVDETHLGFKAAEAALVKARADVSVAEARVDVAKADRDHVQALLEYTKIRAPYDGVVTRRNINTGDLVEPAAANKGKSLFVVEQVDTVRIFVNVQELEAVWVLQNDAALIRPQSLPGQQFQGKVTRFSRALHPQNRTLQTEIDLSNKKGTLMPGMYVTVTIIAERKNVWALPVAAIVTQGEQSFCFRIENGKTVRTPIKVGMRGNERGNELVEVLKKQTKTAQGPEGEWQDFTGDEVIAANAGSLTDGQAVKASAR